MKNSGANSGANSGVLYPIDLIGLKRTLPDTFTLTHLGLLSIQINNLTLTASALTIDDRTLILTATSQPSTTPDQPSTSVTIQLQNFPDPTLTQTVHKQLAIQIKKYNAKPRHYLYERP